jgi:pyruvate formate lyase activating enzyme
MRATAQGFVFNVQRFSVHDGPGIRTTIFLKGCSLHCFWCHNPEGIRFGPDIQLHPAKCIACDECIRVCPEEARFVADGARVLDRDRCTVCGQCTEQCFAGAMILVGRPVTADALMDEVLCDRAFYDQSHGGVTLSGGEPMMQPEFAREMLRRCKEAGIHTAIETAGNYPWDFLEPALPFIDLVMMDLKQMDDGKHRWATGVGNTRPLETAHRLSLTDKPILFRTPIIPTVNDQDEEVAAIAQFVQRLIEGRKRAGNPVPISYELLPFHQLAGDKYQSLGLDHRAADLKPLSKARMHALSEIAALRVQA